jgi:hypothetical protein
MELSNHTTWRPNFRVGDNTTELDASQIAVSGPLMKKHNAVTDLSNDFRERFTV